MPSREEIIAALTAAGPFELTADHSVGHPIRVYRNAPASFRAVFEGTRGHGGKLFSIYGDETLTYDQHYAQVAALAHHLIDRGVKKGDRIAIGMRNYPEWSIAFWACQSIGAIVVALNAWWTTAELTYALDDSGPAALIIDGERLERLRDMLGRPGLRTVVVTRRGEAGDGGVDFAEAVAGGPGELPDVEVGPADLATILYTSGTTGNPKGAMATHRNHVTNLMNTLLAGAVARSLAGLPAEADPNAPQAGILQTFPFFHIGGLTGLYLSVATGARVAMMYKWAPPEAVRLIQSHGLSSVSGVPIVVRQLLETAHAMGEDMASLIGVTSGGAPVPPDLIRRIGDQFQAKAAPGNGYGLTETTSAIITNGGADYLARPDSIGRAVVTADVRIVDEAGQDVARGEIGELWIRGANVIPGYWNNPEATETAFGGGWFRTGDLGYVDAEGFHFVVDRKKDVIIRGGENVYCAEVEAALLEHPKVRDAGLIGLPHPELGEEVAAVIQVSEADNLPATADELRASLAGRLARFKIPTAIRLTTGELPRTATGKLLKREMRTQYF
jgi:acyl-CoA synthetase (AMP-forming)/AMP-acid ligase II